MEANTIHMFNGRKVTVLTGRVVYRLSSVKRNPNAGAHVWVRAVDADDELQGDRFLAKVSSLRACSRFACQHAADNGRGQCGRAGVPSEHDPNGFFCEAHAPNEPWDGH